MTYGKCDACGRTLLYGMPKVDMEPREFCGPIGTDCHRLGVLSDGWRLTPDEGAALLAADVAALAAGHRLAHVAA